MTTQRDLTTGEGAEQDSISDGTGSGTGDHRARLGARAARGAMWALLANFTIRFASIAVTALLARLLSKEDFGVFAVALAVFLVVSSLAELGMGSAIARSAREPEDIAPTVASISILTGGAIAALMAISAPWLAAVLGQPGAAGPIRILSICLFLTGIFAVPGAQLVREFKQDKIFLATIIGFLVANPLLIVLALHGGGATSFAWSRVVGQLATGVVFFLSTSKRYLPGWRQAVVGPLLRFGLPLSIANLVNWSLLNADYLLLGRMVDAAQVGTYMIAFNVGSWSTAILGSILNSVVVPVFGRVAENRAELARTLVSATQLVALLALAVGTMTMALSRPLVLTVFGAKWGDSAPVLVVLSIYGMLYAFSLLYTNVLVATGKTLRLLLIQIAWVAVLVPAIVFGIRHGGLVGVAWAHVITIGMIAVPAYFISVLRVAGQRPSALMGTLGRPLLAAVAASTSAWAIAQLINIPSVALLVGGLAGGIVYLLLAGKLLLGLLPNRLVPNWIPRGWQPAQNTSAL